MPSGPDAGAGAGGGGGTVSMELAGEQYGGLTVAPARDSTQYRPLVQRSSKLTLMRELAMPPIPATCPPDAPSPLSASQDAHYDGGMYQSLPNASFLS